MDKPACTITRGLAVLERPDRKDEISPGIRGTNQRGIRALNERLVLSLLRWLGPLSKGQIARRTGLSPQTTSIIMRNLEAAGLIARRDPVRGRIGQPSVPFALDPNGALFLGLKIGRRSSELLLADFAGAERDARLLAYRHPTPDTVVDFARTAIAGLLGDLDPEARSRVNGLGIAMPGELWNWAAIAGLPEAEMAAWRHRDIASEIAAFCDFPVLVSNDGSAACCGELLFGTPDKPPDFLYVYIGYFAGGGLVLDGSLFPGRHGNAGALGSMPVPAGDGGVRQLLEPASIASLERAAGAASAAFLDDRSPWNVPERVLEAWTRDAAEALGHAALAAAALLDLRTVVLDGWLPPDLRHRLARRTETAIAHGPTAGIVAPTVREGALGPRARSLGAAALVLSSRYMVDRTAIFQD
jgi:predicted NBD/HSP70 family sugar kinase